MAIEQDILIAVKPNLEEKLNLVNFESEKYKSFSTSVYDLSINISVPQWYYYFFCGYKGISEHYELQQKGLDIVVKGTIPPSSGLSSSSALVCASALATAFANRISINKKEIASICALSEQYIGTQGGGMDQAIGFLAEAGSAKRIDFNPLRTTNVPLPAEAAFVVSNSCVPMNKAATSQFNIRVVECKLAAKVLAKKHDLDWKNVQKLAELPVLLKKHISDMKNVIKKHLHPDAYSKEELCSILEISDSEFTLLLSENTRHLEKFYLSMRASHVYEEASRVLQFQAVCEEGEDQLQLLGQLMNESHRSCRDLYECSHPVLDELVQICVDAGAMGSRLTGAGWGGCSVSLVEKNHVTEFVKTVKEKFYKKRQVDCPGIDVDSAIFVTNPSGGAEIYVV